MHPDTIGINLDDLKFDNRFVNELPADPEISNFRRQVAGACFSRVLPTKVKAPKLVAYAKEVAALLDLPAEVCQSSAFTEVFAGNQLLSSMQPYATCYGGHQFGHWAGQLGDGRAINLGEVINRQGQRWALQLKGSGLTPYSRTADGLAVLRSSVREFLCSEAMHHLGVPTTRALSLILSGEQVTRDMFYDGNPMQEAGAIVCRVAPSFTRFGSFQIFAAQGNLDVLKQLTDYTMRTDFLFSGEPTSSDYIKWFEEVCRRTAKMIVHWQRVGFVHGVMNTDNMSILGLTIDYGPYGWLDNYDPDWTPNTTDAAERRYRFGQQPQIALWNLVQLANALYPLIEAAEPLQDALEIYSREFEQGWQAMMLQKLGLLNLRHEKDLSVVQTLLELLQTVETDMTIFFRNLASISTQQQTLDDISGEALMLPIFEAFYHPQQLKDDFKISMENWLRDYIYRLQQEGVSESKRRAQMHAVNPKYVLRNYLAQQAIEKADTGDFSLITELMAVLKQPYTEQPGKDKFAKKRPDWARQKVGCSMLSCSS